MSVTGAAGGGFDQTANLPTSGGTVSIATSNRTTITNQTRNGQTGVSISSYTVTASTDPRVTAATGIAHSSNFAAINGLRYTDYGAWTVDQSSAAQAPIYVGTYGGGKPGELLSTNVPRSGSATYTGGATGYLSQSDNTNAVGTLATFYGTVSLSANFASGSISGSVNGINAYGLGVNNRTLIGTVNDISLTGNFTDNVFTGTALALTNVGTGFDISGASGGLTGGFYGTGAAEAAGTFNLAGGTHSVSVIGSFGASSVAPSDRRLKTDVRLVTTRPNGLKIYRWRYRGNRRRYVGPMAQDLLRQEQFAHHVISDDQGFLWVDFENLGFVPRDIREMRADGEAAIAQRLPAAH